MALNLIKQESKYLRKESCPKCKSKNNLARYDDGHAHCFTDGCDYYEKANGEVKQIKKQQEDDKAYEERVKHGG